MKDEGPDASLRWKELKAKFLRDFLPAEQLFFLTKAREAVAKKGYAVGEDLFQYCSFLTLKERMRSIHYGGGDACSRFLYVEAVRDIEREIRFYEARLEEQRTGPAPGDVKLLEYLSA